MTAIPGVERDWTVHEIFQSTLDKTMHWLKDIKNECGLHDTHQSYTLLRAVLFTLRDRMPINECVHFGAQLPMLIRGFFFEGWVPVDCPKKEVKSKEDFFNCVRSHIGNRPGTLADNVEQYTMGVLRVLNKHIPGGEITKLEHLMPHDIQKMFCHALKSSEMGHVSQQTAATNI